VAIGLNAGSLTQGANAVAVGSGAGRTGQGAASVAIGLNAGATAQGAGAIAIGSGAGFDTQGANAIAIGNAAGATGQAAGSIVLNASGSALNGAAAGFYVNPVRTFAAGAGANVLSVASNEIVINSNKTFVIPHPLRNNAWLVHATLEGPESGIYYRGEAQLGENCEVDVEIPRYATAIGREFTVTVTSKGRDLQRLGVSDVKGGRFTIYGEIANSSVNWTVIGKRDDIEVEVGTDRCVVAGDGPYKYIRRKI
jgi:hypothetical protein